MKSVFSFTSLTIRSKRTASDVFVDFDNLPKLELNYSKSRGLYRSRCAFLHSFIKNWSFPRVSSQVLIWKVCGKLNDCSLRFKSMNWTQRALVPNSTRKGQALSLANVT